MLSILSRICPPDAGNVFVESKVLTSLDPVKVAMQVNVLHRLASTPDETI